MLSIKSSAKFPMILGALDEHAILFHTVFDKSEEKIGQVFERWKKEHK